MAAKPSDILYDPPLIRFYIDGQVAGERHLADLRRVIDFDFGSPLYSNDGTFTLLDFTDTFWIISDDIGLPTHREWAAHLRQNRGYFRAGIYWHPKRWRTGGIFGIFQSPGPRIVPAEPLPPPDLPWEIQGPLNPAIGKNREEMLHAD
jgi:hypothetical protein